MSTQQGGNVGGILTSARGIASTGINLPIIGTITLGGVVIIGLGMYLLFGRKKNKFAVVKI